MIVTVVGTICWMAMFGLSVYNRNNWLTAISAVALCIKIFLLIGRIG